MIDFEEERTFSAKVKIIGIGGGGCNAIDNMIEAKLKGVDFIAANTDAQALSASKAPIKIQLGAKLTKGLGAGANPKVGEEAALEDVDTIKSALMGADMVFVTAGMGGGTGTGGAPIIAKIAKEIGALTVAIVTKPFEFEGKRRMEQADSGISLLKRIADTLIAIPNQRLLSVTGKNISFMDAFKVADDILLQAAKGISDLILVRGLINLDFADVRTIMSEMGMALMGTGIASGENRASNAAQMAISNPLLEDLTIDGARGILINISGNRTMTLNEIHEASSLIRNAAHEDANIIFGAVVDESLGESVRVTVIATGFGKEDGMMTTKYSENVMPFSHRLTGDEDENEERRVAFKSRKLPEFDNITYTKVGVIDDLNHDEYDVPAFLRKQAD
ncbi:MAG: cell division protein FtsZ [Deltaproteobacteria bacterium]|nr:MAG: cell division protein FtsZ [Deltaproteobacteria bacterium]